MGNKVKPAVYSGPLEWGWVSLRELAEIVGQSPKKVWENFFWLSKDAVMGVLSYSPDLEEFVQTGEMPNFRRSLFVPAGWALSVLAARVAGFIRVEPVRHEHLTENDNCPDDTLACTFDDSCFVAAVGIRA